MQAGPLTVGSRFGVGPRRAPAPRTITATSGRSSGPSQTIEVVAFRCGRIGAEIGFRQRGTEVALTSRMVDRRRSPRLAFSRPQEARVRTVHEAVVDRLDGHSVDVTTAHAVAPGKRLVLQCTTGSGEVISTFTQVASCTPIATDDGMQWRLTLTPAPSALEPDPVS